MLEFSAQGASSPAEQEFIATHPGQELELLDTMWRAHALEMGLDGNPPPEDTDLLEVCKRFDISWPEMQVYKDIANNQPLKPHQIAGLSPFPRRHYTLTRIGSIILARVQLLQ